jgi:hypothetical protein
VATLKGMGVMVKLETVGNNENEQEE